MNGQTDRRINGQTDTHTERQTDKQTDEWTVIKTDERTDGQTGGPGKDKPTVSHKPNRPTDVKTEEDRDGAERGLESRRKESTTCPISITLGLSLVFIFQTGEILIRNVRLD